MRPVMRRMLRVVALVTAMVSGIGLIASDANAGLVFKEFLENNDCAGEFGPNFPNCSIPAEFGGPTPIIIKTGGTEPQELNPAFSTITGDEFAIVGGPAGGGVWTYTPGPGDPVVRYWVAKGGPNFNLFFFDNDLVAGLSGEPVTFGPWFTPFNPGGQVSGLSHMSFYDTVSNGQAPEPGSLLLLGFALAGLGLAKLRRS